MEFKKGDKVIMIDCPKLKDKVWTVISYDIWKRDGQPVVLLEGFPNEVDPSKLRKYTGKCPKCGSNLQHKDKAKIFFPTCIKCQSLDLALIMNSKDPKDWVWKCNGCSFEEKYLEEHAYLVKYANIATACVKCKSLDIVLVKNSKSSEDWEWACKECSHKEKYNEEDYIRNAIVVIPTD